MQPTLKLPHVTDIAHKKVLVRVDFNVPLNHTKEGWHVKNGNRIDATLETIQFLIKHQAKVILISHLGRPEGKPNPDFSLLPIAAYLGKALHQPIAFATDCVGPAAEVATQKLQPGQVVILENLRFHPEEEKNDPQFAKALANLAEVYINEAFSASHRAHASTAGITKYLPSFAGMSLAREVKTLTQLITQPKRPFVMVIGGAKISDKVEAVVNLTHIADQVLVGGGVANNFLKAEGFDIARSFIQDAPADLKKKGVDYVAVAEHLLDETNAEKTVMENYIPLPKIIYPIDVVAGTSPDATTAHTLELTQPQPEHLKTTDMFLDIGPKTAQLYAKLIAKAGTVFWNGPMGVFENKVFAAGTSKVAHAIATTSGTTILGGGDTQAAVEALKLENQFDYISTAGGAALEFLAGKTLPGIEPLLDEE